MIINHFKFANELVTGIAPAAQCHFQQWSSNSQVTKTAVKVRNLFKILES